MLLLTLLLKTTEVKYTVTQPGSLRQRFKGNLF